MSVPQGQGIGATLKILTTIEKLLWTIDLRPSSIRSPLADWTGDAGIDTFLGLDIPFAVLPPIDPWRVTDHKVITASNLLQICRGDLTLPSSETLEIAWMWPEDFKSQAFAEYFCEISQTDNLPRFSSQIMSAVKSSPAAELAKEMRSKLAKDGMKIVFCNIRRGEVAFVATKKLLPHVKVEENMSHFYVYTNSFIANGAFKDSPEGHRYFPAESYSDQIYALIEKYKRNNLFIVVSTDGFSKLFQRLSEKPERLTQPLDNSLIDLVNSEFSEVKMLSDVFLPGDSLFHSRMSIIYSAIADILVNGPSVFPITIKELFEFPGYEEIVSPSSSSA